MTTSRLGFADPKVRGFLNNFNRLAAMRKLARNLQGEFCEPGERDPDTGHRDLQTAKELAMSMSIVLSSVLFIPVWELDARPLSSPRAMDRALVGDVEAAAYTAADIAREERDATRARFAPEPKPKP
jgi:hypothetical protein